MALRKSLAIFTLLFLLTFGGCNNIYLTTPYSLGGELELFLDGELVASANLDFAFDENLGGYGFYIDSGDNPVNAMAEFITYERGLAVWEFSYLYENIGLILSDTADLSGYYQFGGDLSCNTLVASAASNAGTVVKGDDPAYATITEDTVSFGIIAPAANSRIQLGDYVLPDNFDDFTINFWFQEELDGSDEINLFRIADLDDSDKPEINLSIDEKGRLVLSVGTN
ncbi:MAG: hypothetical protein PQJ60_07440 [Spirochaetales bacterium]|nr:hypothetical protein [Spirochaetales bacterium]